MFARDEQFLASYPDGSASVPTRTARQRRDALTQHTAAPVRDRLAVGTRPFLTRFPCPPDGRDRRAHVTACRRPRIVYGEQRWRPGLSLLIRRCARGINGLQGCRHLARAHTVKISLQRDPLLVQLQAACRPAGLQGFGADSAGACL